MPKYTNCKYIKALDYKRCVMLLLSCNEDDCSSETFRRGLCKYHYASVRKIEEIRRKEHFEKIRKDTMTVRKWSRSNEATLRCELYHRLKVLGIEMIPEYRDNGLSRYDGVIVVDNKPKVIVEVKKDGARPTKSQIEKYSKNTFKIPVLYLLGWAELEPTIERIKLELSK